MYMRVNVFLSLWQIVEHNIAPLVANEYYVSNDNAMARNVNLYVRTLAGMRIMCLLLCTALCIC